jgi:hypothetical protein
MRKYAVSHASPYQGTVTRKHRVICLLRRSRRGHSFPRCSPVDFTEKSEAAQGALSPTGPKNGGLEATFGAVTSPNHRAIPISDSAAPTAKRTAANHLRRARLANVHEMIWLMTWIGLH